mmetsp:Transcript_20421/g.30996  ORF Transcript_20421/g.30996 Transcript_20421/m.30996 type:complete len:212 (+) Transcript_20421:1398-2033(+)
MISAAGCSCTDSAGDASDASFFSDFKYFRTSSRALFSRATSASIFWRSCPFLMTAIIARAPLQDLSSIYFTSSSSISSRFFVIGLSGTFNALVMVFSKKSFGHWSSDFTTSDALSNLTSPIAASRFLDVSLMADNASILFAAPPLRLAWLFALFKMIPTAASISDQLEVSFSSSLFASPAAFIAFLKSSIVGTVMEWIFLVVAAEAVCPIR